MLEQRRTAPSYTGLSRNPLQLPTTMCLRGVQDENQDEARCSLDMQASRQLSGYVRKNFSDLRFLHLIQKSTKIINLRYLFLVTSDNLLPRCMLDYMYFLLLKKWFLPYHFFFFFWSFQGCTCSILGSQAGGQIGVVAASLHHSHSNMGSQLHLQPTAHLVAMPILNPLKEARNQICIPMDASQIHFC